MRFRDDGSIDIDSLTVEDEVYLLICSFFLSYNFIKILKDKGLLKDV